MIVAIAGDHGGFALKQRIREHLIERGIKIADLGTDSEESVDYPEFGKACAQAVASGKADRGIVICGTGIGISIAANRIRGIRCGLCTSFRELSDGNPTLLLDLCLRFYPLQLVFLAPIECSPL